MDQIISNQTDVAMTLTKHILGDNNTCNVVLSPLSLQLVLGLVAAGSESESLKQLLSFLKAESTEELNSLASHLANHVFTGGSPPGELTLSLANGVWIDKSLSFQPFFSKVVDDVYKAGSDVVDFKNKVFFFFVLCFLFFNSSCYDIYFVNLTILFLASVELKCISDKCIVFLPLPTSLAISMSRYCTYYDVYWGISQ